MGFEFRRLNFNPCPIFSVVTGTSQLVSKLSAYRWAKKYELKTRVKENVGGSAPLTPRPVCHCRHVSQICPNRTVWRVSVR